MSWKFWLGVIPIFLYLGCPATSVVTPPPPQPAHTDKGSPPPAQPAHTDKGSPPPAQPAHTDKGSPPPAQPADTDKGSPPPEPPPEPELPVSTSVCNNIGFSKCNPAHSCHEIFETVGEVAGRNGFYHIQTGDGPQEKYCNMEDEHCGMRGWLLVGDVDASVGACPDNFRLDEAPGGVKVCRGETPRSGSDPRSRYLMTFPVNGLNFTKITGFVEGYQFGNPDAFSPQDAYDMDGITFYYGNSATRHTLWSYAAGTGDSSCPCSTFPGEPPPSHLGNYRYYCDSGNPDPCHSDSKWYMDKVLWSGSGCPRPDTNTCCDPPDLPYFCDYYAHYSSVTTKFMVEVAFNEDRDNEDIGITRLQIYVT